MPTKTKIPYQHGIFFITFTCFQWHHLFEISNSYDLVYRWFDHLKSKSNYINAYVIMPNHIHLLAGFRDNGKSLNKVIGDGKRFIAYEMMERLRSRGNKELLQQLAEAVNGTDKKRGKLHEVWEDSFHWKECRSKEMMQQKITYIHNNPCKGKWELAKASEDYIHSSAKYYVTGNQGIYPVTDFMEMDDIDLSESIVEEI